VRIIGGQFKGRRLQAFKGSQVRPTADRVREAMFNILGHRPFEVSVLDLFSGTGALGIEALSRGAKTAVFIDNSAHALAVLRKNLDHCDLRDCTQTIQWDIDRNLQCLKAYPETFELVFMDPPYHQGLVPKALQHLLDSGCLLQEALVIAEHEADMKPEPPSTHFVCIDHRRYGQTALSFFTYLDPLAR
jgi:16S rRNA (guanine966-N2)-methyltransferase